MRTLLLIFIWASLLGLGLDNGVVQDLFSKDVTYISEAIIAFFAAGFILTIYRVFECSKALNSVSSKFPRDPERFQVFCDTRRDSVQTASDFLIRLGLFGTVYGFLLATSDMDMTALTSSEMAGAEIGGVVQGVSVSFVTTLTGLVTGTILSFHRRILETGYERLYLKYVQKD